MGGQTVVIRDFAGKKEDADVNLQRLFFLIGTTVIVGVSAGAIAALVTHIDPLHGAIVGGFISATSLMGLWAYLTLNYLIQGFLPRAFWDAVQLFLVVVVAVDLVYARHLAAGGAGGWTPYVTYALFPLTWALVAAGARALISGIRAFIPGFFYLFVFTVVEWFPALKAGTGMPTLQIGIVLLVCNTYLLFVLRRLTAHPVAPSKDGRRDVQPDPR